MVMMTTMVRSSDYTEVNTLTYDKAGKETDRRPLLDSGATHHVTPYHHQLLHEKSVVPSVQKFFLITASCKKGLYHVLTQLVVCVDVVLRNYSNILYFYVFILHIPFLLQHINGPDILLKHLNKQHKYTHKKTIRLRILVNPSGIAAWNLPVDR